MSAHCPTILESACEQSRLQSHRTKPQVPCHPLLDLAENTLQSDCTSIDKVDQQSRSTSLMEQLRRELSNHKQCNLPRQIKSLFSTESEEGKVSKKRIDQDCEKLTKKQYDDIMAGKMARYDMPRKREDYNVVTNSTQKTLKESIYEKLIQAKRDKERFIVEVRKSKQNIKEATFRPKDRSKQNKTYIKQTTLNKIKEVIKNKIAFNVIEPESIKKSPKPYAQFFIKIGQDSDRISPPQTKPHASTKYQSILKQNINSINSILTSTNKRQRMQAQTNQNKAKHQSFMKSLKLRESLMNPLVNNQNNYTKKSNCFSNNSIPQNQILNRHRSMTTLTFQQRQKRLLSSRNQKIVKHSIQKQKEELKGCTFKPHLTPYRSNPTQQMQRWSSYAQINKRKLQNRY